MRFQRSGLSFLTCGCKTHLRGQKYHSCGVKMTCADTSFTGAASKLTWAALISNVRQEFYHWNFSKCNTYVRIINVQTGTHSYVARRWEWSLSHWTPIFQWMECDAKFHAFYCSGSTSMGARLHIYYPHVHVTFCRISMIKMLPHTWY